MNAAYTAAGERLHWLLDTHGEDVALRVIADDMQQDGALGPALSYATQMAAHGPPCDREFWRRLAGSLRKATTL